MRLCRRQRIEQLKANSFKPPPPPSPPAAPPSPPPLPTAEEQIKQNMHQANQNRRRPLA
jgi:hypothetical protein